MPDALRLSLTDYVDATRWRWVLEDARGQFLADHTVRLDPTQRVYAGFVEPGPYVESRPPSTPAAELLRRLGVWIGEQVFGGVRAALLKRLGPTRAIHIVVPPAALELLSRPFELACFADGTSFREAGLRLVYQCAGTGVPEIGPARDRDTLRVLAVFSMPVRANPLNLRRERYGLQQLVRELTRTTGAAVTFRVLQYGATRDTLRAALEDGEGWDIVHLSGHGQRGELLLEDEAGGPDTIDAAALGSMLAQAGERLQLLILDACYSGTGSHRAARAQVGLEAERDAGAAAGAAAGPEAPAAPTPLPSLGLELAEQLDTAVLAMRYPVGDAFATDLMLALYEKLLVKRQPLPAALHLALTAALSREASPLAAVTPILLGGRAATMQLASLPARPAAFTLPPTGLMFFPPEPARFVGRLAAMLRATKALAPGSARRGVLFYGMPGAGKTACALELAYRHEEGRFRGSVWYRAPEADSDVAPALSQFLFEIQRQLNAPELGLTAALADPQHFRGYILPRLRALLQQHALLLVLDNLETLLTDTNQWRDPLWAEVIAALLAHEGHSRVVLTSRRPPAALEQEPRVLGESMHALSFAESVLLMRELPALGRLFADPEGQALLRETQRVVQGHPKLLELADGMAGDRAALAARLTAAAGELATPDAQLDAFFAVGGTREGESRQADATFVQALQGWTAGAMAPLSLTARLLFVFLCRLEPEARQRGIVEANWGDFLRRLGPEHPAAGSALGEPAEGLPVALAALQAAGLLDEERSVLPTEAVAEPSDAAASSPDVAGAPDPAAMEERRAAKGATYAIHPGVAEAVRAQATAGELAAADHELAAFYVTMVSRGLKTELEGRSETVALLARRGVPYLLRAQRWGAASSLLELMLHRDSSPEAFAFAMPPLQRIAEATAGTERELVDLGMLARVLGRAGRRDEAERQMRAVVAGAVARANYRLASTFAGDLCNLLRESGRLPEALTLAEESIGHSRQAGLGPWTQLAHEGQRLQVLAAMGRDEEVLDTVKALRAQMDELPEASDADESVQHWSVRESLLDIGRSAAMRRERWEQALALNAELMERKQARGADPLDLARAYFNAHGPLLRLERPEEAREVLGACRAVFEAEHDFAHLGKVFTALAELEDDGADGSVVERDFLRIALAYSYQAGSPVDCAIVHGNFGSSLSRQSATSLEGLAHHLASALIHYQAQSGYLATSLRNLGRVPASIGRLSFAEVAARVEAIPGVRWRALLDRLPRTASDAEAALEAVWCLVEEERTRLAAHRSRQAAVLETLPSAVRAAFALEGAAFLEALKSALAALPSEEAQMVFQQLSVADLIGGGDAAPGLGEMLDEFAPLLWEMATVARGDDALRAEIEVLLPQLEVKGWRLTGPVHRIWAGERDADAVTAGLDASDAALVRELLRLLAE